MPHARNAICMLALAGAVALGACGTEAGTGFGDSVDKAHAAQALSALQAGLVTLSLLQAESAGTPVQGVAAALQAKDPTNRYTTEAPAAPGVVQVLGGEGRAVMLVTLVSPPSRERAAAYAAAWQEIGTTRYYAGAEPPAYTAEPPTGPGWGSTLPQ
jgi:hypothetical protein